MITVIDVCRMMGVEPTPNLTWPVGNIVREAYEAEHGRLPLKALRPKTNGGGSHCFAVYPESWRGFIEATIRSHETQAARQANLFDLLEAAE